MATAMILTVMLLCLLATDLRRVLLIGTKRLAWFYILCYAVSFIVLILHSLGAPLYGPSQLVIDIAKAMALIET